VRERITRLEAAGVIRGYHADIAPDAGAGVSAMLSLSLTRTPAPELVAEIVALPQVRSCYSLGGAVDLLVEVVCPDTAALNALRDSLSAHEAVRSLTTAIILKRDKDG
jgi:Lrp/AsnC family leucine-responsive transcriptional regulator